MKNHKISKGIRFLLMTTILGFSIFSMGQDHDRERLELEQKILTLYEAMVHRNAEQLKELTSENLTYGHSSGTIENKPEFINAVLNGTFQFDKISAEDQTIVISDDIGMVRNIFLAEGTNNNEPANVRIGCLMIFRKEGQWKLLARQAFKL